MSYLALARKWRPRTFSQMVGQEHITKPLINSLNNQRLHHAYLFTGFHGVGKTSVSRILAKALNCEKGITSEPCLECDACVAIEQGRFIDLIEIDGASKTRVEDTREILENVQYAPTQGRFKIYLIDEVHMLSQHSFNALLKTLEEPPGHVKFILATTDPKKLLVTVLSRCLQFDLKPLSIDQINQQIHHILAEEHLEYEQDATYLIAKSAQGSLRDALSILDQAINFSDGTLLSDHVRSILGYTKKDYAINILNSLADERADLVLALSNQIAAEGGQYLYVLEEILVYLHEIAIFQTIGEQVSVHNSSQLIKSLSNQFSPEDIQLFYQIALDGVEHIQLAPTLNIGFNMILLRMLTFRPAPKGKYPDRDYTDPNVNVHSSPTDIQAVSLSKVPDVGQREKIPIAVNPVISTNPQPHHKLNISEPDDWDNTLAQLNLTGFALKAMEHAEFISKNDNEIHLRVDKGHQSLFTPTSKEKIESALSTHYKSKTRIILDSTQSTSATPAQKKAKITQEKQNNAHLVLQSDPMFQQLQQEFSAELVKNSIVSLKDEL